MRVLTDAKNSSSLKESGHLRDQTVAPPDDELLNVRGRFTWMFVLKYFCVSKWVDLTFQNNSLSYTTPYMDSCREDQDLPELAQIRWISPVNTHHTRVKKMAKVVTSVRLLQEQISAVWWRGEIRVR